MRVSAPFVSNKGKSLQQTTNPPTTDGALDARMLFTGGHVPPSDSKTVPLLSRAARGALLRKTLRWSICPRPPSRHQTQAQHHQHHEHHLRTSPKRPRKLQTNLAKTRENTGGALEAWGKHWKSRGKTFGERWKPWRKHWKPWGRTMGNMANIGANIGNHGEQHW